MGLSGERREMFLHIVGMCVDERNEVPPGGCWVILPTTGMEWKERKEEMGIFTISLNNIYGFFKELEFLVENFKCLFLI